MYEKHHHRRSTYALTRNCELEVPDGNDRDILEVDKPLLQAVSDNSTTTTTTTTNTTAYYTILASFMFIVLLTYIIAPWIFWTCSYKLSEAKDTYDWVPSLVGFGSCSNPFKSMHILDRITERNQDVFVWLGDNIYADTTWTQLFWWKYQKLSCCPEFQRLVASPSLQLATWDDHDFGENDSGGGFSKKWTSRDIFMKFWRVPENNARRKHDAIYHVHRFRNATHSLNIVILDLRWDRTSQKLCNSTSDGNAVCRALNTSHQCWTTEGLVYCPDQDGHIMGEEQWQWLEQVLQEPVNLTVVCSSTQMLRSYNSYENWDLYPQDLARFMGLVEKNQGNVVVISGDVHYGEVSVRNGLYDITSSGLTHYEHQDSNLFRVGQPLVGLNFGELDVWSRKAKLFDEEGKLFLSVDF